MQKILLLGKSGMLGSAIFNQVGFFAKTNLVENAATNRSDLDITDKKAVFKKIMELKPNIVINTTGYTNVNGAETEPKKAFKVNAESVGNIAEACINIKSTLIHISTDYVFNGTQPSGYKEDDIDHIAPLNVYGKSKLAGEEKINFQFSSTNFQSSTKSKITCSPISWSLKADGRPENPKYFIIRTSWLYGAGGKNFVNTMIQLARKGKEELRVVNDQFGLPTFTKDLAEQILWMAENAEKLESGIYHLTNSKITCPPIGWSLKAAGRRENHLPAMLRMRKQAGQKSKLEPKTQTQTKNIAGISWFNFAKEIFAQAYKLGIIKKIPKILPCATAEFPMPAKRPKYSVLVNTKLPKMRNWQAALQEYLSNKTKPNQT